MGIYGTIIMLAVMAIFFVIVIVMATFCKKRENQRIFLLDDLNEELNSIKEDLVGMRKAYRSKEKWYKAIIDEKQIQAKAIEKHVKDTELHNAQLKAVNESVVDALIDRQEYIQVIEKAVETICSLCDNAPNCEGCYWKSVQDDLILPYRNRTGIVNKDAKDKFAPPAADETDIEDYLPRLSEIEKE